MEILTIITFLIIEFVIFWSIFRVGKVAEFRRKILILNTLKYYKKLPSFDSMVFSFKKLRLSSYFAEDDIENIQKLLKETI